jgi:hypothetical protein
MAGVPASVDENENVMARDENAMGRHGGRSPTSLLATQNKLDAHAKDRRVCVASLAITGGTRGREFFRFRDRASFRQ